MVLTLSQMMCSLAKYHALKQNRLADPHVRCRLR